MDGGRARVPKEAASEDQRVGQGPPRLSLPTPPGGRGCCVCAAVAAAPSHVSVCHTVPACFVPPMLLCGAVGDAP